jgi:hypothetical protein
MRWIGIVLLGSMLSGCASTRYVNPLADARAEMRDGMECRALAEQGTPVGGLLVLRSVIVEQKVKDCLLSRGYSPELKAS